MQGFVRLQDSETGKSIYMNVNSILLINSDGTAETLFGTLAYGIPFADFCKKVDDAIRGVEEEAQTASE